MRFLDVDVLLYAISRDADEQDKAARASSILQDRDLALSVQVLQEFYMRATHPSRPHPITHDQATRLIGSFLRFPVVDMSTEIMLAALTTGQRFGLSYWDAAIVEAARAIDCDVVLSESLIDGRDYGGVRVENPFH